MLLVKVDKISKVYKMEGSLVQALNNVSLTVNKGDFISIMGRSGSGKSTLMHLIGCLDTPTSGKIIINNQDVSTLSEKNLARIRNKEIGFIFQSYNLLPKTSALANVELPLIYSGIPDKERKKMAVEALSIVGLSDRSNHFPSQLSGGQQQRVAIARALVTKPSIILADEPTGNLDTKSGTEIMELFKKLAKNGNTIIVVTHDSDVASYTKKIIHLKDGMIEK